MAKSGIPFSGTSCTKAWRFGYPFLVAMYRLPSQLLEEAQRRGWASGSWMKSLLEGRPWGAWPSVLIPMSYFWPRRERHYIQNNNMSTWTGYYMSISIYLRLIYLFERFVDIIRNSSVFWKKNSWIFSVWRKDCQMREGHVLASSTVYRQLAKLLNWKERNVKIMRRISLC